MRVTQVNYDENTEIEQIGVVMSRAEAIALVNLAGVLNGHAHEKLNLQVPDNLYNALADLFNSHYEDGVPSLGVTLSTLNEKV